MTKRQFIEKVKELIKVQNKTILEKAELIFELGGINLDNFENDFLLPKAFMTARDKRLADDWSPLTEESKEIANRIALLI